MDATIQEKDLIINKNIATINEKDSSLQAKDVSILEKDDIIQRMGATISQQRREIASYRDNPHWVIQKEEIEITGPILGVGGWGEVKVGTFRGTKVAVKCLHQLILSDYYLELFSREMDIASRVCHPNLLQFIGATRVNNPLIVTELMPTNLRKEIEKSPMVRGEAISIAIDIGSGLNYLHLWKPQPILH